MVLISFSFSFSFRSITQEPLCLYSKVLMQFLSFSDNLLQDAYHYFSKSVDNFKIAIVHKTLNLVWVPFFIKTVRDHLFRTQEPLKWNFGLLLMVFLHRLMNRGAEPPQYFWLRGLEYPLAAPQKFYILIKVRPKNGLKLCIFSPPNTKFP